MKRDISSTTPLLSVGKSIPLFVSTNPRRLISLRIDGASSSPVCSLPLFVFAPCPQFSIFNFQFSILNSQFSFFAHRWTILATRLFIAAACLGILSTVHHTSYIVHLSLSLVIMLVLFALYNRWRNRYNVFLYVWLVFSRFVPFMCLAGHGAFDYILLFVSYPLLIGLERFSMPSYRWGLMGKLIPDEPSKARFRAAYYCLALVILVPYCLCSGRTLYPLTPIAILAVYRILRLLNNKSI